MYNIKNFDAGGGKERISIQLLLQDNDQGSPQRFQASARMVVVERSK